MVLRLRLFIKTAGFFPFLGTMLELLRRNIAFFLKLFHIEDHMKFVHSVLFVALLSSVTAFAAVDLKAADSDKDGTIDRKEAASVAIISKNFDAIDLDKDGTIDSTELAVFNALLKDKDSDGTLDKIEAKGLKKIAANFDAIDADKDGTVDSAELSAYFAKK
jgi:hypothetical protein